MLLFGNRFANRLRCDKFQFCLHFTKQIKLTLKEFDKTSG